MHSVYPVIVSEKSTAVQKKVQVNADKLAVCFGDQSLPCAKRGGSAFGAPAKPSVSGFAGERRSSGATALSALKAETKDAELATMGAPAKPSVSGFAGERRSSGATALSALKAETKDAELATTRRRD